MGVLQTPIQIILTYPATPTRWLYPKKLAEANAVMRKVCLSKDFFAEKETTKEIQIA